MLMPVFAADTVVRTGSFEVFSVAGDSEAKIAMNFAEQLRYTLGYQLGNADIATTWPVRILVLKKGKPASPDCKLARDAYVCSLSGPPGPEFAVSLTRIVLDSWNGYLPPALHRGLLQVFATISIDGTRITLGAVPPQKDRDWARAHMLAVDPQYSGKLRVMLNNLSKGVEAEVAYRNAFAEGPEQLERSLDKYLEAGKYGTIPAQSRPLNAQRQLIAKDAPADDLRALQADLLLVAKDMAGAKAAYQGVTGPAGHEGLGLIALAAGDQETARKELALSASARGLVEAARLEPETDAKRQLVLKAATANPRWAEPQVMLAALEAHPAQKLPALKKATQIQPGRPELWAQLAELQDSNKQFADAAKSWAAAERATGDPESRERIRAQRMAGEQKRMEADLAAKAEARRRTEEEMDRLRNSALAKIREAESKANAGRPTLDPTKLDVYKEGTATKKVSGSLIRVECIGQQARLVISPGKSGKNTVVMVQDPAKVVMSGGGEKSFGCGLQKPARNVTVEYSPRSDVKAGIAGDAVMIEFQ